MFIYVWELNQKHCIAIFDNNISKVLNFTDFRMKFCMKNTEVYKKTEGEDWIPG